MLIISQKQVFNFAFAAVIAAATFFGTGRHLVVNVLNQPEFIITSIRTAWIGAILHYPPLTFTKVRNTTLYSVLGMKMNGNETLLTRSLT